MRASIVLVGLMATLPASAQSPGAPSSGALPSGALPSDAVSPDTPRSGARSSDAQVAGAPEAHEASGPTAAPEVALILLAPDAIRAPWTAALQIELAAGGRVVVPMSPPEGATPLIRDAAAQAAAIERGAPAAARVEATATGWTVRVVRVDDSAERGAPVAREADPRTAALIVTSLLDDAPLPPAPAAIAAPPSESLTAPAFYPRVEEPSTPPPGPTVRVAGLIGTMGFALANDRHVVPGSGLRGGVGLRYDAFEAAMLGEVALILDDQLGQGSEIQPFLRGCLEFGAAIAPTADVGIHLGARSCGGYAEFRERVPVFGRDPSGTPFDSGSDLLVDVGGAMGAAGGYLAVSFAMGRGTRFHVRADVEGSAMEPSPHLGEVMTTISGMVAFE